MKKIFPLFFLIASCAVNKTQEPKFSYCPVCNMKVDLAEAYKWKYNNSNYYFDSYNCKEAFKMNPEKFIKKQ